MRFYKKLLILATFAFTSLSQIAFSQNHEEETVVYCKAASKNPHAPTTFDWIMSPSKAFEIKQMQGSVMGGHIHAEFSEPNGYRKSRPLVATQIKGMNVFNTSRVIVTTFEITNTFSRTKYAAKLEFTPPQDQASEEEYRTWFRAKLSLKEMANLTTGMPNRDVISSKPSEFVQEYACLALMN